MKERALYYHEKGYNCSFVILKAGAEKYGVALPEEAQQSCCAVSSGFGVGSICCALVGAVLLFGLLFSEEQAKLLRMKLFVLFHDKYETLNCCAISAKRQDCIEVIGDIAELTEQLIEQTK